MHEDQFERKNVGDIFDARDSDLYAIVTANRYVYQTHKSGVLARDGTPSDDERAELGSLVERVPTRDVSLGSRSVSPEIRNRLEELGYA